jgi:cobalt-zinc-cadmium efflux system outer membrane protein
VRQTGARVARSAAQRELVAAQVSLAAQWGDTQGRPTVALKLVSTPQPAGFEQLESRLAAVPDLARYATESALREAEVRLARAQAVADWRWSIGVRRYERTDDQALAFGWSMPLNGTRRAAPAIRESLANRAIVEQQAEAARIALRPVLFEQWQLLQTLRERVIAIGAEDLPRALEALEITERGYRIGRFPYRELALAQSQLLDLELQRLDAAAQYHLTRLEIDRLTGAEISQLPENRP